MPCHHFVYNTKTDDSDMAAEYRSASSGAEDRIGNHTEGLHNRSEVHFQCTAGPRSRCKDRLYNNVQALS